VAAPEKTLQEHPPAYRIKKTPPQSPPPTSPCGGTSTSARTSASKSASNAPSLPPFYSPGWRGRAPSPFCVFFWGARLGVAEVGEREKGNEERQAPAEPTRTEPANVRSHANTCARGRTPLGSSPPQHTSPFLVPPISQTCQPQQAAARNQKGNTKMSSWWRARARSSKTPTPGHRAARERAGEDGDTCTSTSPPPLFFPERCSGAVHCGPANTESFRRKKKPWGPHRWFEKRRKKKRSETAAGPGFFFGRL